MEQKQKRILAINLGSTSSMVSVFEDETAIAEISISHTMEEITAYPGIDGQYQMRKVLVEQALKKREISFTSLDAIAVRGMGAPGRYSAGAYLIDDRLVEGSRQGAGARLWCAAGVGLFAARRQRSLYVRYYIAGQKIFAAVYSGGRSAVGCDLSKIFARRHPSPGTACDERN